MNPTSDPAAIKVRAPGKLILTGEHAVVYGNPAIATAINKYVTTTIKPALEFEFTCNQLNYSHQLTISELRHLKHRIQQQYNEFLHGKCELAAVILRPMELLQYSCINFTLSNRNKCSSSLVRFK